MVVYACCLLLLVLLLVLLPARVYCRLMDPDGPNLRRLYLPGLDALKEELSKFEYLLSHRHPQLHVHLQVWGGHGVRVCVGGGTGYIHAGGGQGGGPLCTIMCM